MDILGLIVIIGGSIYAADVLRKKYNRTRHAQTGHRVVNTVTNQQQAQNQAAGGTGTGTQQATTTQGGGGQTNSWRSFFSNLKLPRMPGWVLVAVIAVAGLAYFWPTTDTSTVSTATEMIQKGIEKGSEAASSTTKAAAESNFFVWMMEHPVVAVVVAILIFWIASALFDLRNVKSTGLLGRVFYVVLSCIAISLTFIALRMFILYGPEGAIKRTQTYWEKNVESVEESSSHALQQDSQLSKIIPPSVTVTAPANNWSEPVIFAPGFRVDWNGIDFETQVRVVGNPKWLSMTEWQILSEQGAKLQAVRHKGLGRDATVVHTYSQQ